jgi:hypothetical protein
MIVAQKLAFEECKLLLDLAGVFPGLLNSLRMLREVPFVCLPMVKISAT